jgi:hypothetical protein
VSRRRRIVVSPLILVANPPFGLSVCRDRGGARHVCRNRRLEEGLGPRVAHRSHRLHLARRPGVQPDALGASDVGAHATVNPVAAVTKKYSQRDRAEAHGTRGTAVCALRVCRQLKERLDLRSQPSLQPCVPLVRVRVAHSILGGCPAAVARGRQPLHSGANGRLQLDAKTACRCEDGEGRTLDPELRWLFQSRESWP